jgi:hypothetical protein
MREVSEHLKFPVRRRGRRSVALDTEELGLEYFFPEKAQSEHAL